METSLPDQVQRLTRWLAQKFAEKGEWPTYVDTVSHCFDEKINFDEVSRNPPIVEIHSASQEANRFGLRCWALEDSGLFADVFSIAGRIVADAILEIAKTKAATTFTDADIAQRYSIDIASPKLAHLQYVLSKARIVLSSQQAGQWSITLGIDCLRYPIPTFATLCMEPRPTSLMTTSNTPALILAAGEEVQSWSQGLHNGLVDSLRSRQLVRGPARTTSIRPKYQVFISSTYQDLHECRGAVTWEILKAGHIPAGMENFPATDNRGWEIIQKTIDRSDYYVLLLAGRYGTVDGTTGISWTHREYEYARTRGIPVLTFIRKDDHIVMPAMESDSAQQQKLRDLKKQLRDSHLCESWTSQEDLLSKVIQALRRAIDDDEDGGQARPGWYRGDQVPASPDAMNEFARLSSENVTLQEKLASLERKESRLVLGLAGGDPIVDVTCRLDQISRLKLSAVLESDFDRAIPDRPTDEDLDSCCAILSSTLWLEAILRNEGNAVARNVVVDFTASPCANIFMSIPRPWRPAPVLASGSNQLVQVQRPKVEGQKAFLRQRLNLVGAGSHEELLRIGFQLPSGIESLEVGYVAGSEDGIVGRGIFTMRMSPGAARALTKPQLLELIERHEKR